MTFLKLDSFDFDRTHKSHQDLESVGVDMGKEIIEKLVQVGCFPDEHCKLGVRIEIFVRITGPDMNRADTALYNKDYDTHFEVLDSQHIAAAGKRKGESNSDHLTKIQLSYFMEIIHRIPNKIIGENHGRTINAVKSMKRNIRSKTNYTTPKSLQQYVDLHHLTI